MNRRRRYARAGRCYARLDQRGHMPPKALLLDLDGTLLDGSLLPSAIAEVCEVVAANTVGLEAARLLAANRAAWQACWPQLEDAWALGHLSPTSVCLSMWRRSLYACGYEDEDLAQLALRTHQQREPDTYRLFDDARALLATTSNRFRLGIVTNGAAETQRAKLRALDLERHADTVKISAEIGSAKPDPEIFRFALKQLAIDAGETWHVGDSTTTDIVGAKSAGLTAIWLNRTGRARRDGEATPDLEIQSLRELEPLFAM